MFEASLSVQLVYLAALAIAVVVVTQVFLIRGLEELGDGMKWSTKARGQLLGYATSMPELAGTVGTAWKGLIGAGLWNIASSNIINLVLFFSAAMAYRRVPLLFQRKFLDEIAFALAAIGIPLVLLNWREASRGLPAALLLFAFFVFYLVADRKLNKRDDAAETPPELDEHEHDTSSNLAEWLSEKLGPVRAGGLLFGSGVLGIVGLGEMLGRVAETIVYQLAVPEAVVGWLLGVITSLPEMTTFFVVFAAGRRRKGDADCQQNLDNLCASNMSNLGLVYPLGILVFLLQA